MLKTEPDTFLSWHTPGPWIAEGHQIYGPKHEESKHPNGRILVCNVIRGSQRRDPQLDGGADRFELDSEADVALIACAPALLDAAKQALIFMENCFEVEPPDDHELEIYHALRQAIASAGGFDSETRLWEGPCICFNPQKGI